MLVFASDVAPLEERDPVTQVQISEKEKVDEPDPILIDEAPEDPEPPRPAVVLVHGFGGFAEIGPIDYSFGVAEHLAETQDPACGPPLANFADHLEEIGQPVGLTPFDHLAMYEAVIDHVLTR